MRVFVVLFLTILAFPSLADLQKNYISERLRLLQDAQVKGFVTEEELDKFDSTTVAGRYFRFSIRSFLATGVNLALSEQDIAQLQQNFPELYAEFKILVTYLSDLDQKTKIDELEQWLEIARSAGWARLVRWMTALLVESEIATGNYGHALFRLYEEIDFAPNLPNSDADFDYPLAIMQRDMATTLYYLSEYEKSLQFCHAFPQSLPSNTDMQTESLLCQIRAQIKLGHADKAMDKAEALISQFPSRSSESNLIVAHALHAETLFALGRYEHAKSAAAKALTILNEQNSQAGNYIFDISLILANIHLQLNNLKHAKKFADKAEESIGLLANSQHHNRALLNVQSKVAEAQGNYSAALKYYKSLYQSVTAGAPSLPWTKIEEISAKIDNHEIVYLRKKAGSNEARSNLLYLLAIPITLFLLSAIIFYLIIRKKQLTLLSFNYSHPLWELPGLEPTARLIKKRTNKFKHNVLILLDVNLTQTGPPSLNESIELASHLSKKLSKNDVLGQYDKSTFVILLSDYSYDEAIFTLKNIMKDFEQKMAKKSRHLELIKNYSVFSKCGENHAFADSLEHCAKELRNLRTKGDTYR